MIPFEFYSPIVLQHPMVLSLVQVQVGNEQKQIRWEVALLAVAHSASCDRNKMYLIYFEGIELCCTFCLETHLLLSALSHDNQNYDNYDR
jgi:hypothetical protein